MLDNKEFHSRLAERIARRLKETGKAASAVSRAAGYGPDFIRDYLSGRKKKMSADALARIARELGTTAAWLQGDDESLPEPPAPHETGITRDRAVPLFGSTVGEGGRVRATDEIVEMLVCPHGLEGVRDVYALYVARDTMEPRFRLGDVVFVTPHRPPRPGDDVVISYKTESGETEMRIKQYLGERGDEVCALQHNPRQEVFFKRANIVEIHRIAPINDLIGV
jgi:phage repressor protein C with HTH and peptisase S24 domain